MGLKFKNTEMLNSGVNRIFLLALPKFWYMRSYLLVASVMLFTFFVSCVKENTPPDTTPPVDLNLPAETFMDVEYGYDAAQKMDIYLPAKRTTATTKVLFLMHEGAWFMGDKSEYQPIVDTLKQRLPDWAIVNINYRLAAMDGNWFPTQELDINKAILTVLDNRNKFAISDKWVYIGESAGGHLALLQGYKNNIKIKPKAIVNFYGPSDLNSMMTNPGPDSPPVNLLEMLFNNTATVSSPITYINAQSPPTITFQGTDDLLVPAYQATNLHQKLKAANVPEKLVMYPHEGHGFSDISIYTNAFDQAIAFLNIHVK